METEYKGYHIWSEYVGEKCSSWDPYSNDRHHKIHIKKGNQHINFDYWTSKARPEIKDEKELLTAMDCFFSDADFGQYSFEEYCREQGYDVPDGIIRSYKACVKAGNKVQAMFGHNWQDFAEEMREDLDDK